MILSLVWYFLRVKELKQLKASTFFRSSRKPATFKTKKINGSVFNLNSKPKSELCLRNCCPIYWIQRTALDSVDALLKILSVNSEVNSSLVRHEKENMYVVYMTTCRLKLGSLPAKPHSMLENTHSTGQEQGRAQTNGYAGPGLFTQHFQRHIFLKKKKKIHRFSTAY